MRKYLKFSRSVNDDHFLELFLGGILVSDAILGAETIFKREITSFSRKKSYLTMFYMNYWIVVHQQSYDLKGKSKLDQNDISQMLGKRVKSDG